MATETDKVLTEERVEQARQSGQLTARRERLICCGVVRQSWHLLRRVQQRGIEIGEEAAEQGRVKSWTRRWQKLARWGTTARAVHDDESEPPEIRNADIVPGIAYTRGALYYDVTTAIQPWYGEQHNDQRAGLIGFLRSLQNPFLLPVFNEVCPQPDVRLLQPAPDALRIWRDCTVVRLAQAIYQERAWDRMPILGDALEEAACTSAEVPAHCRSGGIHVRGCWVIDWLLDLR
jgi:hypothetical protein